MKREKMKGFLLILAFLQLVFSYKFEHCPGNWALDSSFQCAPVQCKKREDGLRMDLIRSMGRIICDISPFSCTSNKPCPSLSMLREPHTCNCLKISHPCPLSQYLSGNIGGPYECVDLLEK
jgi:hypothetical protein